MRKKAGIYVHIPFCAQKCAYCDFLSGPADRRLQWEYVKALKREIAGEAAAYSAYGIETVFLGGGTPSILDAGTIRGVLDCIREHYGIDEDAEITMEMNPGTATREKLAAIKASGVNRLSIGLQSADDNELKMLGRIHTYEDFGQTYMWAREAGFANINIDLISAIPGQHMESWTYTLRQVLALEPEHISAYSLIVEEGTRLYDGIDGYPPVPDEEEDRRMYQMTKHMLAEYGYQRYEISNYARTGYECRHNKIYWQRGIRHTADYIGFGLGASSAAGGLRWKNTEDMERYLGVFDIKEEIQRLSVTGCMEEYMFLGLRMAHGVSEDEFMESFGNGMEEVYGGVLRKWIKQGMLERRGGFVRLTDAGIDVSNHILVEFLL